MQTCYYDPSLTSCLLSNCLAVSSVNSVSPSYSLTNYTLSCTANIYYKTRCLDSPPFYHLYYSSSQQNSACRQQRLNRINACLNSTVQLLDVPCLISVSSGTVTYTTATCTQSLATSSYSIIIGENNNFTGITLSITTITAILTPTFSSEAFSSSDDSAGHAYRISSVNSENYPSTRKYSVD